MGLKLTMQGYLIYATMGSYIIGATACILGSVSNKTLYRIGLGIYTVGFLFAAWSYGHRWANVGTMPLRSMFDIHLFVGTIIFPISMSCFYFLRVKLISGDMILGSLALFPAGFVEKISPEIQPLPPALQTPIFYPHITLYMIAYAIMFKAGILAIGHLATQGKHPKLAGELEQSSYNMAILGLPLLTAGLILGCWWASLIWGDWWNWDPKEQWSLASWLAVLVYLHFRKVYGKQYSRINSILLITSAILILLTLWWVNMSPKFVGLHNYG